MTDDVPVLCGTVCCCTAALGVADKLASDEVDWDAPVVTETDDTAEGFIGPIVPLVNDIELVVEAVVAAIDAFREATWKSYNFS